jgi:hypothetical protein
MRPLVLLVACVFLISSADAASVLPMITAIKGEAKILVKEAKDGLPSLLYEGEKFYYRPGKIGERLNAGTMIICDNTCRVKLVYPSGTSLYVAPGTALKIVAAEHTPQGGTGILNLFYGRIRALVSKKRTATFNVKTPGVVTGVRGTDFLIRHVSGQGTEVTVLSGTVDVKPVIETEKAQIVQANQTAIETPQGQVEVSGATKPQILSALEATAVPFTDNPEPEVKTAEAQSKTTLLEELKIAQPEVYQTLKDPEALSTPELNRKLVDRPLKKAKASPGGMTESFEKDLENYKKLEGGK